MAGIKILRHEESEGRGLNYEGGVYGVKVDNSGNVQLSVSAAGLKADAPATQLPAVLNGASIDGTTITFTKTEGDAVTVELPAIPVDVKLQSLAFNDQGKLVATLSDNSTTEVEFTSAIVVKAILAADQAQKTQLKTFLIELLKGDEAKDFGDNVMGYFLASA